MSAIGSYVRIRTQDLDRCLELASPASDAFAREWQAAVVEEVVFEASGHVLSAYFLAQNELNALPDPFDSPDGLILANVFTAAFPARAPQAFPELDGPALRELCESEWGADGAAMFACLVDAHAFFKKGLSRIREHEAVVFIIS